MKYPLSYEFSKSEFYSQWQATEQFVRKFEEAFVQPKPSYALLKMLSLKDYRLLSTFSSSKIPRQTPHTPRQTDLG